MVAELEERLKEPKELLELRTSAGSEYRLQFQTHIMGFQEASQIAIKSQTKERKE